MDQLVKEMREKANTSFFPDIPGNLRNLSFDEMQKIIRPFQREVEVDGYKLNIILTRTTVLDKEYYQMSMSNNEGRPDLIPAEIVAKVKTAFVPDGVGLPSILGNSIQFIERINS